LLPFIPLITPIFFPFQFDLFQFQVYTKYKLKMNGEIKKVWISCIEVNLPIFFALSAYFEG
jgi:hypothetical protein